MGCLSPIPSLVLYIAYRETEQVGIYRLEWLAGDQVLRSERFAINLFEPQESDNPTTGDSPSSAISR